jgi:hypothetical protein
MIHVLGCRVEEKGLRAESLKVRVMICDKG